MKFMSESIDALAPDFVALQSELEPVAKTAANPFFKSRFAPLPDVVEALKPVLARHNFGLSTLPAIVEGSKGLTNGLRFMLIHTSGQWIGGEWELNPAQPTPQGEGADVTYKRRFGMQSITGLVADDDDDGHSASVPAQRQVKVEKPKTPADMKRDELRKFAAEKGFDLKRVADKFSEVVAGGELRSASADDVEAFLTSLEAGVVVL